MKDFYPKIKEQVVLGFKILKLVVQSSPKLATIYFASNTVSSILPVVNLYLSKLVIDAVVATIPHRTQANILDILFLSGLILITQIINNIFWALRRHSFNVLKDEFGKFAIFKIANHTASLDAAFFENPEFHDKLEKVQREVSSRPFDSMGAVTSIVGNLVTIISLLFVLLRLAWWIPLVLIIVSLPRLVYRLHFSFWTYSITDRRSPHNRRINQVINILLGKNNVHEVKIFALKGYLFSKFNKIYDQFIKENTSLSKKGVEYGFAIDTISTSVLTLTNLYAIYKTILSQATLGDLTLFLSTMSRFQITFTDLTDYLSRFYENSLFLKHYFEFLELKPKIVNSPHPVKIASNKPIRIEFKNVSFGYENAPPTLKNINLIISDARNYALVGENGAGKTTLIKLMLRLYDVTEGEVLINGINIKEIELTNLHDNIGVIFQNFQTYEMTVKENIGFGDIERINEMGKIEEAAKLSGASEFIEKFPDKYDQMLGKFFEKGEELSGGQWQKIALARAFFRKSKVLIMDEPTSALDPRAEFNVFKNLITETKNKSLVLISHRFSTVRLAKEIIVMHEGQIIEQGSHEQLMEQKGHYAKLYNLQAKWYK